MSGLHATPTRRMLLDLVDRGEVVQYQRDSERPSYLLTAARRVTGRIAELAAAGWVELPEPSGDHVEKWLLTEAGRKVLEAGRG